MLRIAAASLACLAVSLPALAQQAKTAATPPAPISQQDRRFLDKAAEDNTGEIAVSLLAQQRAQNPAVRAFARLMVSDHTALQNRIAHLANEEKFDLSVGTGGQQATSKLQSAHGDDFDRSFMQAQLQDHRKDVNEFQSEAAATTNTRVSQLAAETVPILQEHLQLAEAVNATLTRTPQTSATPPEPTGR